MSSHRNISPQRILVIDDNPAIHTDYRKILQPRGQTGELNAIEAGLFGLAHAFAADWRFELDFALQGEEGVAKAQRAVEAATGDEAVATLRRAADTVQLMITDGIMPGDTDGMELCRHARTLCPGMPVIITSGYSRDVLDGAGALPEGCTFLGKPFDIVALATAVRRHLDAGARTPDRPCVESVAA